MTQITRIFLIFFVLLMGCGGSIADEEEVTETAVSQPTSQPQPTATQATIPTKEPTSSPNPTATTNTTGVANADVTYVRAVETAVNTWIFYVTVAHPDTGWEDYADGWDVVLPDGTVILPNPDDPFTRLLLHPHETEQPFTRSQSNIMIPEEVTAVTVRAHDLVDGFGGAEIVVDLTNPAGDNYEVERMKRDT